jgi:hypothetical protein
MANEPIQQEHEVVLGDEPPQATGDNHSRTSVEMLLSESRVC